MSTIGEKLRYEREQQGLSLHDIEQATSIRVRYLQAIEDGNYSILPGEVYTKGFIRNYAMTLGFDGPEFVNMYKLETNQSQPSPLPGNTSMSDALPLDAEHGVEPIKTPVPKNPPKNPIVIKNKTVTKKLKLVPALLVGVVVLCLAGSFVYFMVGFLSNKPADNTVARNANPASQAAGNKNDNKNKNAFRIVQENSRINIIPEKGATVEAIKVEGSVDSQCWAQVLADDREVYRGMLRKGEKFNWQAKNILWVKLGDASAVNMTVNGEKTQKLGGVGEVIESTITILK